MMFYNNAYGISVWQSHYFLNKKFNSINIITRKNTENTKQAILLPKKRVIWSFDIIKNRVNIVQQHVHVKANDKFGFSKCLCSNRKAYSLLSLRIQSRRRYIVIVIEWEGDLGTHSNLEVRVRIKAKQSNQMKCINMNKFILRVHVM